MIFLKITILVWFFALLNGEAFEPDPKGYILFCPCMGKIESTDCTHSSLKSLHKPSGKWIFRSIRQSDWAVSWSFKFRAWYRQNSRATTLGRISQRWNKIGSNSVSELFSSWTDWRVHKGDFNGRFYEAFGRQSLASRNKNWYDFFIIYWIFQMIWKKLFCQQHSATSFVEEAVLVKPKMATRSGHTGTISALISTQTLNLVH